MQVWSRQTGMGLLAVAINVIWIVLFRNPFVSVAATFAIYALCRQARSTYAHPERMAGVLVLDAILRAWSVVIGLISIAVAAICCWRSSAPLGAEEILLVAFAAAVGPCSWFLGTIVTGVLLNSGLRGAFACGSRIEFGQQRDRLRRNLRRNNRLHRFLFRMHHLSYEDVVCNLTCESKQGCR